MEIDGLLVAAPANVFRRLLDRLVSELEGASYVEEWLGPGRRLPVFDVDTLRSYAGSEPNRERLVALLASYVRVASGSFWERSHGRWRRRRYSELDPVDLAEMGAFRRLGDLTLFLSGVFPEYVTRRGLEPRELERIARLLDRQPGELARAQESFWSMEWVGVTAYRRAGEEAAAAGFRESRRLLNLLTERYLFTVRDRWFPGSSAV